MSNQPTEPYDVAAEVQRLTQSWNPPPEDHSLERLVGVPTDAADVAATAHVPMAELNQHLSPTDSKVDAQRLQDFQDDGDDGDDYLDELDKATLQDMAEKRGLSKSGSKDDLKARIRESDAGSEEDDSDEE